MSLPPFPSGPESDLSSGSTDPAGAASGPEEGSSEGAALDLVAVAAELGAVEAALERLDAGTYGTCGACGDPIDAATLEADPVVVACAAHLPLAPPTSYGTLPPGTTTVQG